MRDFLETKVANIKSIRLLEELRVFIWKNGKAQAMQSYNDDLVMSFAIGMYLRDTSLKFKTQNQDLARAALNNIGANKVSSKGFYTPNNNVPNPYQMDINGNKENLSWLI
jgi:hypothetical protein